MKKDKIRKKLNEVITELLNEDMKNEYLLLHKIHQKKKFIKSKFYSQIFKALTDMELPENKAKQFWHKILGHRKSLSKKLGGNISFRVAMLDYFIHVNNVVKNPMIIEIKMYEEKTKLALIDGLTGLYNRSYMNKVLSRETKRSKRHGGIFSVLFIDIDNFKKFNDTYGHLAGDRVLTHVSKILYIQSREEDVVTRYGGEEFVIVLPHTTKNAAVILAERLRKKIQAIKTIPRSKTKMPKITISGGISEFPTDSTNTKDLLSCADRALFLAKEKGKNRISPYNYRTEILKKAAGK